MNRLIAVVLILSFAMNASANIFTRPMPEEMLKRTGGRVVKPGSLKGEIVIVNAQDLAKAEWIDASVTKLAGDTLFTVRAQRGAFDLRKPALVGNATLFVIADDTLPMSLVAPEAHWALVNVTPLKSDKPVFFEMRVRKEIARTFALLCGGANSRFAAAIVGPVAKLETLDNFASDGLPVDVIAHFASYMAEFGATPAKPATYINACRQGWAPAPTNEYQKAIWEKVHAIPQNPMKIKYSPAAKK